MTTESLKNVVVHNGPPPLLRLSGSHRQIGQQFGEAAKKQVVHSLENARMLIAEAYNQLELTWDGAQIQARKYLPFAEERYPQYVDELKGIAEGAGVLFDDIMVLNAMEAVTMDALHLTRCTSMAVSDQRTLDGHVLAAHNEDWVPDDEDDVLVLHVTPEHEPPFLAMSYGGLLPNIGMNAHGIAQMCDSVYPNDSRIGIPRIVASRAVLAASSPAQAIKAMLVPQRAAGYNHLLVHESGEIYNVEVSARRFSILYADTGVSVHTNHFLAPRMQEVEKDPEELINSRVRYFRANRLLNQSRQHSIKSLQIIQRDHVNYPNSICNHAIHILDPMDREKTINAIVMDLTAREMHVAWGSPCANQYHTFHLNA